MTRRDLLEAAVEQLEAADVEDARRNAEWMLQDVLGATRAGLYAHAEEPVPPRERALFETYVSRRAAGEPVQYVLGHAAFRDLDLEVSPDVLIPRPETEELVDVALGLITQHEAPWVLDVGTGSGAIALALKRARPDAEVFACDVSERALAVAAENAARYRLAVSFIQADVLAPEFAVGVPRTFDLVISNPPYVAESERAELAAEVREHEPDLALFVPDGDPLRFYRALAGHAARLLRPAGYLALETHAERGEDVRELLSDFGFEEAHLSPDLAGRDRIVTGRHP